MQTSTKAASQYTQIYTNMLIVQRCTTYHKPVQEMTRIWVVQDLMEVILLHRALLFQLSPLITELNVVVRVDMDTHDKILVLNEEEGVLRVTVAYSAN